jgi:hypothetical protein
MMTVDHGILGGIEEMEKIEAKQVCHHHMHRYVRVVIQDGRAFDGFVEDVNDEQLYLAVPVGHEMNNGQMENTGYHDDNNAPLEIYANPSNLQPTGYEPQKGYGHQQVAGNQLGYGHQQGCGCNGMSGGSGGYPGVDSRAFFPGYYPAPAPFPVYGYNPYGRRRFNRIILPLALLSTLALLPYY